MKKITMYTGPLCNYCEAAKRLLARNNAPYNEIDISDADKESIEFHKDLGIDFKNAGHGLSDESRNRLIEIDKRLIELGITFSENIATNRLIGFTTPFPDDWI